LINAEGSLLAADNLRRALAPAGVLGEKFFIPHPEEDLKYLIRPRVRTPEV
jgi:hypothetical protein